MRLNWIVLMTAGILSSPVAVFAKGNDTLRYELSMPRAADHIVHVRMECYVPAATKGSVDFKMPQWSSGFYQIMNFGRHVSNFSAAEEGHGPLEWTKEGGYTWQVSTGGKNKVILEYDVEADSAFVANSFLDTTHAYIQPAGTFLNMEGRIAMPVSLTIKPYVGWNRVAVGLDSIAGKAFTYTAPDLDVLYDSPILAGDLEELPNFKVGGVVHRFIGYKLGDFDKLRFMADLKRIVEAGVAIVGDIPYKHYTFLAIGPGNGGIEHLTSAAISFSGKGLEKQAGRRRMMAFIAHEFFHTYNVKRIRPLELGPFDYYNGSRTRQLWISEGWSVYYEYLILRRAGLCTDQDLYDNFRGSILNFEKGEGRHFQSLAQSSEDTWRDGPFGVTGDRKGRTISYYDKGPVVALMLDFSIRHYTGNKKSLDDVVRILYNEYFKKKKRGFTEDELRQVCERTAGRKLPVIFDYVYTTKELDYTTFFGYGGLTVGSADRSFDIRPVDSPDTLQAAIRKDWVK